MFLRILCLSIVDTHRKEFESAITRVSSKRKEYIVCILIKEIASIIIIIKKNKVLVNSEPAISCCRTCAYLEWMFDAPVFSPLPISLGERKLGT